MTLDSVFKIKRLSTLIHIGIFITTITVFALWGAFALQSSNENFFTQSSSQSSSITNNNATTLSVNLGNPVIESKGMIQGMKVLELQPLPKLETSFTENDTIKGSVKSSEIGTYSSVMRPDNTLYGESKGIIITLNGELATWTGQGIGHFLQDGKIKFTGSLFFSTPFPDKAGNLAFLNNMVGISFMKLIKMEKLLQKYGSWNKERNHNTIKSTLLEKHSSLFSDSLINFFIFLRFIITSFIEKKESMQIETHSEHYKIILLYGAYLSTILLFLVLLCANLYLIIHQMLKKKLNVIVNNFLIA